MKKMTTVLALLTACIGSQAKADNGLRHVQCFSNSDETGLIFSGNYQILTAPGVEPIRARLVVSIQNGQCILGDEATLPSCMSMSAMVFLTPPCAL